MKACRRLWVKKRSTILELDAQCKLHKPGKVGRVVDCSAVGGIVGVSVRNAKLGAVEEVEELGAELDGGTAVAIDAEVLEDGGVPVVDSGRSYDRIVSRSEEHTSELQSLRHLV